jgi:hypothetical protein
MPFVLQILAILLRSMILNIVSEAHVLQINNQDKVHRVSQQVTAVK